MSKPRLSAAADAADRTAAERAARSARERVRKLLRLARDQDGTPEGDAAARIARRIMARLDLDAAQVAAMDDAPDLDPIVRVALDIPGRVLWRRRLATAVARHCACVLSWSPSQGRAWLYGRQSGVVIAEYLLAVLTREVEDARAAYDADLPMMIGEARRRMAWHHFTSSAVLAIDNRLKGLRREEQGADPEQAALVHRRDAELRDWLEDKGMDFKKGAPDAFCFVAEGYAAGHAIALHDAVTAGTPADGSRGLAGE